MAQATQPGTKHSKTCKMQFGRKDPTCPRCQELLEGAPPRKRAWRLKSELDADRKQELDA